MQTVTRTGLGETIDNQRIMKLVEEALGQPEEQRQQYLKEQCGGHAGDFEQAWHYVEWEQRMQGFLLEPVIQRDDAEVKLEAGQLLQERFRIVGEVAQGGMGVVYEAQDEKLGRRIALKCAKAGFGHDLPPEVRHATEVSHPNVCKIYEIHTTRLQQHVVDFITMEFLEGETLLSRLRRGRIPLDEAQTIARQLAAGLAEAHHRGVIHGDIKSNNVILTKSSDGMPRAVITDFGLARMEGTGKRGVWGTPGYMAPELWLGEQPSVASDLYALGVLYYEMATGELPDKGRTPQAISKTLKATPWLEVARKKPPRVSAYWDRILGRCLDPDPTKRYATTDQLVKALEPGHRRRNTILSVAAGLAIAVTGVVTYEMATAPAETVKLAVVQEGSAPLANASHEIGRLSGTKRIGFALLVPEKAGEATHVLRASITRQGEQMAVHAALSEAQTQSAVKSWDGLYDAGQRQYVAKALAGVVSAGLHLTPLRESTAVNARAQSDFLAGVTALQKDAASEAARRFEMAKTADGNSAVVWAGLAEAKFRQYSETRDKNKLLEAKEAERQAELRYLDTAMGHRAAADLEQEAHRYENAAAHLLRAIELEPAEANNYRRLGYVYYLTNQFEPQLRAYQKAVELDPQSYANQLSLGQSYLYQIRYKEAVPYLSRAVKLNPSAADGRFALSEAYTDLGKFDKARDNLNAIKVWGANEHFQLATILMYEGKDEEAIPHLLSALAQRQNVAFWTQLEIAQRRTGHLAESKEAARQGLALAEQKLADNPGDGDERAFLGYFSARLGQRKRAESETAQALRLGPHEANVILTAVGTYEALNKRDEALEVLRSAAPVEMLEDLKRWPDLTGLAADSRFISMTAEHAEKKESNK